MPLLHPPDPVPPAPVPVRVVGLGASAGGLAPLEAFLAAMPPDSGLAFVVVQHLDPTRKALLTELLRRSTPMPVAEATDGLRLQPDQVFVIPPGQDLTVSGGHLRLKPPTQPRGLRLPIDHLFASLAADCGPRAIGVVLSGMGSDGSIGLQAIHEAGGLTLVQSPATAQYPAMPQNALAGTGADIVAAAAELPQRLLAALGPRAASSGATPPDTAASLDVILQRLREHTQHDLSEYKPSTLRRRIDRRLAVHGLDSLAAYADLVRRHPPELDLLFQEVLIGVTRFFRDPEVWDELRDRVMPELLESVPPGRLLRAWVAGCSTGEEAYTLAMVHAEAADAFTQRTGQPAPGLQVFASDLSPAAIAVARCGQYGPRVADEVGPQRLARFFRPAGGGHRVVPSLRDRVLFARHDVIRDPPFTRLDLLSCRNLLIYFNAALQRRLLPLFGYSLRPGGVLLLGGSETVGPAQHLFTPINPRSRLYWRSSHTQSAGAVDFPVSPRPADPTHTKDPPVPASSPSPVSLQTLAEQALLQVFAPAAVLVNEQGDVLYVHGSVGAYLEPAAGKANWNIHVMARPGIRTPVAVALRQARLEDRAVALADLPLDPGGAVAAVSVTVAPAPQAGLFIVAFRPALPPSPERPVVAGNDASDEALRAEVLCCKDEMAALRREMLASAEELQAANEALQSTNEELQSANEELTTSKEESQSMNEELQTLNQELQTKLDDLALAHSDMQNLLNSTDIATLFLDNDLHVRRFTEPVTRLIHLRESDIGRPLSDLASTLNYPDLDTDARQTLRTLTFAEKEITTTDGHWYMVRIKPYRTLADLIQGVVITFIDITAAKELESRLRQG